MLIHIYIVGIMNLKKNHKKLDKKRRIIRILAYIVGIIALFLVLVYAGARTLVYVGQKGLYSKANSSGPKLDIDNSDENSDGNGYVWQDGWVRYNGDIYEYNEDILTFLVMGIDKKGVATESWNLTGGGQSDALFLLIVNPHNKQMSIFAIDRNTMTDVTMVGVGDGGVDIVSKAQIAVQHGFGDGGAGSCELTRDAVSKLLFDLPIHGYISVNYEAIPYINDAVGGVEVTIPEDAAGAKWEWNAGDTVTLKGQDAIRFVKWRDTSIYESARLRTKRQKMYLTSFVDKAMEATKKDITMPITLYNKVKRYTVTDISIDEMSYLASELISYKFSGDQIYTMNGETVTGDVYEEFYPDMEALKEQMIGIFYEKVDVNQ